MTTPPSVQNYTIAKGIVYFTEDGTNNRRDVGNCKSFNYTPSVQTKPHVSGREGVATVDYEPVTQVGAKVDFVLDEIVPENAAYIFLSDVTTNTAGYPELKGLTKTQFKGILEIDGTSEIGTRMYWIGQVTLTPSGSISLLEATDNYAEIPISAKVEKYQNCFGKLSFPPKAV